jgi:hypothetical protein
MRWGLALGAALIVMVTAGVMPGPAGKDVAMVTVQATEITSAEIADTDVGKHLEPPTITPDVDAFLHELASNGVPSSGMPPPVDDETAVRSAVETCEYLNERRFASPEEYEMEKVRIAISADMDVADFFYFDYYTIEYFCPWHRGLASISPR